MNRRDLIYGGATALAALAGTTALLRVGRSDPAQAETFEVTKTDAEWRAILTDQQFAVLRQEDTEYPGTSPLLHETRKGNFNCAGCDLPLYSSQDQVRFRHRLAKFLGSAAQCGRAQGRRFAVHGPHRSALPALRRPSRPRLRRRPAADRQASLHQRRRADLQAGRRLSSPAFSDLRRRRPRPAACASASRTPPAKQTARSAGRTRP